MSDPEQFDEPQPQPEVQAGAEAIEVPAGPETGDDAVDSAVAALSEAMHGSLEEQVSAYEAAHRTLQDRLADVEG